MKIIVLGAAGQIGSAVFNGLREHFNVIGTSRKSSNGHKRFDPFQDDWATLGKTDVVVNCIGQIDESKNSSFYRIHVDLVKRLLKSRALLGNPRIIQISALGASTSHQVEFLRTKGIADELLVQHDNVVVLRPSIVCTPATMIVRKLRMLGNISRFTLGFVLFPKAILKTRIQPVMAQDLVDIVHRLCVSSCGKRVIDVVGPDALTVQEIFKISSATRKTKLRIVPLSRALADFLINRIVSVFFPRIINSQQYKLLYEDNIADSNEVKHLLRREPLPTHNYFIKEFSYARD